MYDPKGCELVDSLAFNPHKMLGAPLQTSPFLTRHKDLLFQEQNYLKNFKDLAKRLFMNLLRANLLLQYWIIK